MNDWILGIKMIHPVIKLTTDAMQTAPAAISFTSLITGWIDSVTTFESFSMVVLIISSDSTSAEQKSTDNHSVDDTLKTTPKKNVIEAITNWIRKFFSKTEQCFIPCNAYLKEFINRIKIKEY